MRAGCALSEVAAGPGMTLKEAIHYEDGAYYVPLGGAGGSTSIPTTPTPNRFCSATSVP